MLSRHLACLTVVTTLLSAPSLAYANSAGGLKAVGELLLAATAIGVVGIVVYGGIVTLGTVVTVGVLHRNRQTWFDREERWRTYAFAAPVVAVFAALFGCLGWAAILIPVSTLNVILAVVLPAVLAIGIQIAYVLGVRRFG